MSDEDLVRRWDASTGAAHVGAVRSWLQASGSVGVPEPFGRVGGRVDLRGLPLSAPVDFSLGSRGSAGARDPASYITIAILEFRGVGLAGLDMRGALLSHVRFFSCSVEDCVFDDSACLDWRLWATDVRRCSFVETST